MSTAEYHFLLGGYVKEREKALGLKRRSLLAAAHDLAVPIYTSSPGDSSIGMNVAEQALAGSQLRFDVSADVNETSGFCTQYCGWHTRGTISGTDIKYAFIGNPDRCPSACQAQTVGPNGNAGADGMASIIAHELEEAVTDPDLNAWYDSRGMENADKCAWTFGSVYLLPNGAYANMVLGGLNYLIQRNWVNASGGYCATSY